ncbi:hypothetical protein G6F59_017026 [Rhizopus arrhizus]|nr:hypothetical protein G6F59_017026 [Rhizopus arrhizus]
MTCLQGIQCGIGIGAGGVRQQRIACRLRERPDGIGHQHLGLVDQVAVLAASHPPDQRAVAGIELFHAANGFDHLRPGQRQPALLGHDHRAAAAGNDAHATERAVATTDQRDHRDARSACIQGGAHDLGNGNQAGIGFVQAYAAAGRSAWRRALRPHRRP